MRIGVAYYPEHWPEDRWPVDARMMREMGIDVVRLGEFAWSRLEPRRGQFDAAWLERAIEVLAREGLKVILCTPTAAPPPWLFNRHPGMVPQDQDGRSWSAGSRRDACLNNRPYRRYVRRIVREVAKAFAQRPEVFAWQIDNELGCHASGRCYCDDCEQAFREWLMRRYGTIERLNKLWGTAFWSQEFNDWHQIPAPRRTPAGVHPSLMLDYQRFTSATVRDFVNEQRELIQESSRGQVPITTNCIGLSTDQIDQFSLALPQDVASLDNYPVGGDALDRVCLQLDLTRSLKDAPFWILEQQAGPTMIPGRRSQPRPGQLRLWSFQAAARGAELISYFRWRTCAFAQEMHWYGILEPDGTTGRRHNELKATIAELKQRAQMWAGRLPAASVAMVLDYHAYWALRGDAMSADLDYLGQFSSLYGVLRRMGFPVAIVQPGQNLAPYKLLVVPMPVLGRTDDAKAWKSFVSQGGTVLVTAPAGYRTEQNTWLMSAPPGSFAELLGVEIVEHDVLRAPAANHVKMDGQEYAAGGFCSVMELRGAEALAVYGDQYYAGTPVATRMDHGAGRAYFLGATGEPELHARLLAMALRDSELEPHPWSSDTIETIPLQSVENEPSLSFVLNHAEEPVELDLGEGATYRDLLTDQEHSGKMRLDGYGVALLSG